MSAFLQKVLARFQANSVSLQSADQNLNSFDAELADRFAFLRKISSFSDTVIREGASKLVNRYDSDLQSELAEELVQFKATLQTKLGKEALQASESENQEEGESDESR